MRNYLKKTKAYCILTAKTIPTAHVISSAGGGSRPDHLHFTPAGYRELGKRYAVRMLSLLSYKQAEAK